MHYRLALVLLFAPLASGQEAPSPFAELEWRNLGPGTMGGRATDVEGVPGDPRIVYAAAASGGVWKTTDGGVTWKPIFDDVPIASIGDIALEPGNPSVVYVGTGESNLRNSVSPGNGVYKSTDGGATFRHLGLDDSRHIARIAVDPKDPQRVFVAAVGHAFGPNAERGVFRSVDGGTTWENVLYVDERHGASDLDVDPDNPNVVFAALWHFERKPWTLESGSEEGGVFKSVDGGTSWKKIDEGLPKLLGRVGVKVAPSSPNVVYVIAESREGTLFRSEDGGESFENVSKDVNLVSRGFYFADLRVDPTDPNRVFTLSGALRRSIDGGKTFERISATMHSDYHGLWIDPESPDRMWQAQDGGIGVSYSGGDSWDYVDVLPISQYYAIFADDRDPFYYVGGGMQDNATWYGPSRNGEPFGILNDDWREISNGDGFQAVFHPDEPEITLTEYQGGTLVRTDNRTREVQFVSPYAPTPGGAPAGELEVRFNWNAPVVASPHDGKTVYFAGNRVFRTRDFGATWETISPDLTTNDAVKLGPAGGPVWEENTTAEYHCTVISFAESAAAPGVLWAGTDDGNLQLSRDAGATWVNVAGNLPRVPAGSAISHVEPSRREAGRAYVAVDRHLLDDFRPYVFTTSDFGASFRDVSGDLPEGAYVFVLREDPRNPELIYAGTELGLYATRNGGAQWERLHLKNLPTVAVHDLLVHPRDNDLILGTHGRGLWIFDDATPLQELAPEGRTRLFPARRAIRFSVKPTRYGIGDKRFLGKNPPYGALVSYYLETELAEDAVLTLEVLDGEGRVIRTLDELSRAPGVHRTSWDLRLEPPEPREPRPERDPAKGEEEAAERGPVGPRVPPGRYVVKLTAGESSDEETVVVVSNPAARIADEELADQYRVTRSLWEMQSRVNHRLRELDSLLAQMEERRAAARSLGHEISEELESRLERFGDDATALLGELGIPKLEDRPDVGEPPRLSEKLADLLQSIDAANARPTSAQVEYFERLVSEQAQVEERVRSYYASLASLQEELGAAGIPPLLLPD